MRNQKYTNYVISKLSNTLANIETLSDEDFGADLIGTAKNGKRVCVKCEYTGAEVTENAIKNLYAAKKYYKCDIAMLVTNSSLSKDDGARDFAEELHIITKEGVGLSGVAKPTNGNNVKSPENSPKKAKKKIKKRSIIAFAAWILLILMIAMACQGGKDDNSGSDNSNNTREIQTQSVDETQYKKIDCDLLHEYGKYLVGEKFITVVSVNSISGSQIKAYAENTTSSTSYFFDFVFEFASKSDIANIKKEDKVTIAGEISEAKEGSNWDTITFTNCYIIGKGEIADELLSLHTENEDYLKQIASQAEEEKRIALENEILNYKNECETVSYGDIERNPEDYEGKKIKVSGKVIQVSEGWLDGVTLRVDNNGETWYVTYTHKENESRILEGDYITCYGVCDGVKSYTAILGNQITIPSLKMEYYE